MRLGLIQWYACNFFSNQTLLTYLVAFPFLPCTLCGWLMLSKKPWQKEKVVQLPSVFGTGSLRDAQFKLQLSVGRNASRPPRRSSIGFPRSQKRFTMLIRMDSFWAKIRRYYEKPLRWQFLDRGVQQRGIQIYIPEIIQTSDFYSRISWVLQNIFTIIK